MLKLENLKFDENGLIPAVVQNAQTGEVLTVAYMNMESLKITIEEKQSCFWSRSRKELWRKGETSTNTQRVVAISADCDADALVVKVLPNGPACHTGTETCFFEKLYTDESWQQFSFKALYSLLEERKNAPKAGSYTSYLFEKGQEKILKKVGEECTEVVISAMKQDAKETVYEISDLCYHVMVLMVESGITTQDIELELANRHVVDHKVKQEVME